MLKIKFSENPIPSEPLAIGAYFSDYKEIYIKSSLSRFMKFIVFFHEFGHFCIDCIGYKPFIKHYLNLSWEYISIVFTKSPLKWAFYFDLINKYYLDARKNNIYCY